MGEPESWDLSMSACLHGEALSGKRVSKCSQGAIFTVENVSSEIYELVFELVRPPGPPSWSE